MYLKIRLFELAKKALSLKYCILFMISHFVVCGISQFMGTLLAFAGQQKVLAFAGRTYESPTSPGIHAFIRIHGS